MRETFSTTTHAVWDVAPVVRAPRPSWRVLDVVPYRPTTSLQAMAHWPAGAPRPWKLDWNEATIEPSPRVREALADWLARGGLNLYADPQAATLRQRIARRHDVHPEQVLVTNGSDAALELIARTYMDPEVEAVVPVPTYTHMLVFIRAQGGRVVEVTGEDPFRAEPGAVLRALTPATRLVYLVSPNNPTGAIWSEDDVARVARALPRGVVVVDEAYAEFAGTSALRLVDSLPNVVITRTFSKALGLASLRVGYAVGHPELIAYLRRLHNPKSVNAMGQVAAMAALDDIAYVERYVAQVHEAQALVARFFARHGIRCTTTPANWVLIHVADPEGLCRAFERVGVFVRDRSNIPALSGTVRMTVGTPAQMEDVLARIEGFLPAHA